MRPPALFRVQYIIYSYSYSRHLPSNIANIVAYSINGGMTYTIQGQYGHIIGDKTQYLLWLTPYKTHLFQ